MVGNPRSTLICLSVLGFHRVAPEGEINRLDEEQNGSRAPGAPHEPLPMRRLHHPEGADIPHVAHALATVPARYGQTSPGIKNGSVNCICIHHEVEEE